MFNLFLYMLTACGDVEDTAEPEVVEEEKEEVADEEDSAAEEEEEEAE